VTLHNQKTIMADRAAGLDLLTRKYQALDISVIGDIMTANDNNVSAADGVLTALYGAPAPQQPPALPQQPAAAAPAGPAGSEEANAIKELKQMTGLSDTIILGVYLQQGKNVVVRK